MNAARLERTPGHSNLLAPLAVGATAIAGAAVLHLRDPHDAGSYPTCPFLALTGLPCPGCGSLRAVSDLTQGDVAAAISSNALAVALVAGLVLAWSVWLRTRLTGRSVRGVVPTPWWGWGALAVIVVFGVVRNLPAGAWLAP